MEKPIITIKNIGKRYNITHQKGGYIALRDVIASAFKNPFKFIAAKTGSIGGKNKKEEFWALRGIDLEVKKGEVIGIIGSNGAGKSTLLKILSQITPPTEGEIVLRGRVGSLLEVGTGFHPELSGRENIFLNGAILGMRKKEIAQKFDKIVEFAGIEKFLDTPVKYYSSGMYVRLAFSVAAHMEPDILIVDEVLAVGDAEFQKKCLGKMEEITRTDGRTIIFVSHNMSALQRICKKGVLLKKGRVEMIGDIKDVIDTYLTTAESLTQHDLTSFSSEEIAITAFKVNGTDRTSIDISGANDVVKISIDIDVKKPATLSLYASLKDRNFQPIGFFSPGHTDKNIKTFEEGTHTLEASIRLPRLMRGRYFLDIGLANPGIRAYVEFPLAIHLTSEGQTNKAGVIFEQAPHLGYEVLDGTLSMS